MKKGKPILAFGIIMLAALVFFGLSTNRANDKAALASCLTEKGFSLAGTSWCTHCSKQRTMFGNAAELLDYRDCDEEQLWCQERGISAYPTWVGPLGSRSEGIKNLNALRQISDCR